MFTARRFQLLFLACASVIALFFALRCGYAIKNYLSLRTQVPARVSQWELEEIGDRWAIRAVYAIDIQGKTWLGSTLLRDHRYLNEDIAFRALQQLAKQDWKAWYSPKNPSKSSLEKTFPSSLLIRALIAWSVLVYFFFFRRWLANKFLIN